MIEGVHKYFSSTFQLQFAIKEVIRVYNHEMEFVLCQNIKRKQLKRPSASSLVCQIRVLQDKLIDRKMPILFIRRRICLASK